MQQNIGGDKKAMKISRLAFFIESEVATVAT
jgi:hypothetical protein